MNLGEFIKYHRLKRKMSIRKLALYSEVSNAYISLIESGKSDKPSPDVLKKLAAYLDVPYEELLEKAGYIQKVTPSQTLMDLLKADEEGDPEASARLDRISAGTSDDIDLDRLLDSPHIWYKGIHLNEQDKQRIKDMLTGMFWDKLQKRD